MRPTNHRRILLALVLGVTLASIAVAPAFAGGGGPPKGIYTCDWIAAHPAAAAAARVTCDAAVFSSGLSSQAGAPTGSASTPATPDTIDANGCQHVPNGGGRVGKGVFAWSTYEYSNQWAFNGFYSPSYYTFYIQRTDGTNAVYGPITDTQVHSIGLGANVYRWGAQNHSDTAQNWYACYYTV
jgi:hypothetical protein